MYALHITEEFQPNQSSDDDEETIAKAEEEMKLTTNHKEEVELLKRESEIPLEDLLKDLPPDYLEVCNKGSSPQDLTNEEAQNVCLYLNMSKRNIYAYSILLV